jgi:PAS domain S-box-containing protein
MDRQAFQHSAAGPSAGGSAALPAPLSLPAPPSTSAPAGPTSPSVPSVPSVPPLPPLPPLPSAPFSPAALLNVLEDASAALAMATTEDQAIATALGYVRELPGVQAVSLGVEAETPSGASRSGVLRYPVCAAHAPTLLVHGGAGLADGPVRQALDILVSILNARLRPAEGQSGPEQAHPGTRLEPEAVVTIDADGRVVTFNPHAEELFGYRTGDVRGQRMQDLLIPTRLRAAHQAGFRRYLATGAQRLLNERFEMPALRSDGTEITVEMVVTEVAVAGSRLFTAVMRDVTRARHVRDLALAELAALKTRFVASVSHELRTPLTSLTSFAELLADSELDRLTADQRDSVEAITRNAHRLHRLVGDLLLIAKLELHSLPFQVEPVDLAEMVAAGVREHGPAAREAGLTLITDIPPGPPVLCDPVRVGQSLGNLLSNAVKFTPPGGSIRISGTCDLNGWTLRITDTGVGVEDADLRQLFTPFFRGLHAREHNVPGTGLGLVISRALIEAHGGTLTMSRAEGGGTVVIIQLPFDRTPARPAALRPADRVGPDPADTWTPTGPRTVVAGVLNSEEAR